MRGFSEKIKERFLEEFFFYSFGYSTSTGVDFQLYIDVSYV
jgi:hypothetical protein